MTGQGAHNAPDDLVELGRIVSGYGVRGWVKIQPHSSSSDVLRKSGHWWLHAPIAPASRGSSRESGGSKAVIHYKVLTCRTQGATVVAQLESVNDRDQAEALLGYTVHVSKALFPQPKDDEYYWVDLEGCAVFETENKGLIGRVTEVTDNGAHAILRVQRFVSLEPQVPFLDDKGKAVELLIPFVEAHVQRVDIKTKTIETDWPLDF